MIGFGSKTTNQPGDTQAENNILKESSAFVDELIKLINALIKLQSDVNALRNFTPVLNQLLLGKDSITILISNLYDSISILVNKSKINQDNFKQLTEYINSIGGLFKQLSTKFVALKLYTLKKTLPQTIDIAKILESLGGQLLMMNLESQQKTLPRFINILSVIYKFFNELDTREALKNKNLDKLPSSFESLYKTVNVLGSKFTEPILNTASTILDILNVVVDKMKHPIDNLVEISKIGWMRVWLSLAFARLAMVMYFNLVYEIVKSLVRLSRRLGGDVGAALAIAPMISFIVACVIGLMELIYRSSMSKPRFVNPMLIFSMNVGTLGRFIRKRLPRFLNNVRQAYESKESQYIISNKKQIITWILLIVSICGSLWLVQKTIFDLAKNTPLLIAAWPIASLGMMIISKFINKLIGYKGIRKLLFGGGIIGQLQRVIKYTTGKNAITKSKIIQTTLTLGALALILIALVAFTKVINILAIPALIAIPAMTIVFLFLSVFRTIFITSLQLLLWSFKKKIFTGKNIANLAINLGLLVGVIAMLTMFAVAVTGAAAIITPAILGMIGIRIFAWMIPGLLSKKFMKMMHGNNMSLQNLKLFAQTIAGYSVIILSLVVLATIASLIEPGDLANATVNIGIFVGLFGAIALFAFAISKFKKKNPNPQNLPQVQPGKKKPNKLVKLIIGVVFGLIAIIVVMNFMISQLNKHTQEDVENAAKVLGVYYTIIGALISLVYGLIRFKNVIEKGDLDFMFYLSVVGCIESAIGIIGSVTPLIVMMQEYPLADLNNTLLGLIVVLFLLAVLVGLMYVVIMKRSVFRIMSKLLMDVIKAFAALFIIITSVILISLLLSVVTATFKKAASGIGYFLLVTGVLIVLCLVFGFISGLRPIMTMAANGWALVLAFLYIAAIVAIAVVILLVLYVAFVILNKFDESLIKKGTANMVALIQGTGSIALEMLKNILYVLGGIIAGAIFAVYTAVLVVVVLLMVILYGLLIIVSKFDKNVLKTAPENAKAVIQAAKDIMDAIINTNADKDEKGNPDGVGSAILNIFLGFVTTLIYAILLIVMVVVVILLIVLYHLMAYLATLKTDKISGAKTNAQKIIQAANDIMILIENNGKDNEEESDESTSGVMKWGAKMLSGLGDILLLIINFFKFALLVLNIVLIIALYELIKKLAKMDPSKYTEKATDNAKLIIEAANTVMETIFAKDDKPETPTPKSSWLEKLMDWGKSALSSLSSLVDVIKHIGKLALTLGALAAVAGMAKMLKDIAEFNVDTKTANTKIDDIITVANGVVDKLSHSSIAELDDDLVENLELVNDATGYLKKIGQNMADAGKNVNGIDKVADSYIKFIDKINTIEVAKLDTTARTIEAWAKITEKLNGDFNGLAVAVNEHIAPALEKLNETMDAVKETQQNIIDQLSEPIDTTSIESVGTGAVASSTPSTPAKRSGYSGAAPRTGKKYQVVFSDVKQI